MWEHIFVLDPVFTLRKCIRTVFGAHPAYYPVGTGSFLPGVKRLGREAGYLPLSSTEVKNALSYNSTLSTS